MASFPNRKILKNIDEIKKALFECLINEGGLTDKEYKYVSKIARLPNEKLLLLNERHLKNVKILSEREYKCVI